MIRGLYTSAWSMQANMKKMDVISSNLANVNTNGYKKDTVVFESFPHLMTSRLNDTGSISNPSARIGSMSLGSDVGMIYTYFNQGQTIDTGNSLDFAINDTGNSFFTVAAPDADGNVKEQYTRDGAFALNQQMQLVNKDGNPVIGENGPIVLSGEDFILQDDGTIIQDGNVVDKLLIRSFTDPSTLRKIGNNLLDRTAESQERQFDGVVQQRSLEQSNVNIINEMVNMISVMRIYETNQKTLTAQDGTLDKAVNEVGVLR